MDALAQGYGSDSSNSSSTSTQNNDNDAATKKKPEAGGGSLTLLASAYSDGNDDGSEQSHDDVDIGNANTNANVSSDEPVTKRQKTNETQKIEKTEQQQRHDVFPTPRIANPDGSDNPYDALVLFPKNYVTKYQSKQHQTSKQRLGLATKLDHLYQQFYNNQDMKDLSQTTTRNSKTVNPNTSKSNISFAQQLKNQKEFGNPHLFPSIISHFGIDPRGSNLKKVCCDVSSFSKFEYVERIVQKEEENRIRIANASHGTT